ncbi:unnamed protein product [Wuchereria bancrofti]|uniref:Uncharacterized protein n=2 Tax=Wuchereria bancrofti TaxID=6293 RepID=A0A3P7ERR8_WUCBA|nr:unnamed protein product [Wuchereria bancrofti]
MQMYLKFITTITLVLVIISEERLWKNAESLVENFVDGMYLSIFINNFVGAAEIVEDYKLPAHSNLHERRLIKRSRRQLIEAEIKSYATILITSAVIVALVTFVCLIIILHIFIYMRWGITRQLILLNTKVCALESRLGTRQLSEELQRKLCEEIGVAFGTVQNERQKFVQEVVNEERKMVEEVVKSESEPQYETMCGIGDEVFTTKKGGEKNTPRLAPVPSSEKPDEDNHYENVPKPPAVGGMVDEADPKYQTLVGIDNEKIFSEKKAPTIGGMVDQADPAYQTLVGMENGKVFQEKGK